MAIETRLAQCWGEPDKIVEKDALYIGKSLKKVGYDRGEVTYIITARIMTLMDLFKKGQT